MARGKVYFGQETQDAIIEYNSLDSDTKANERSKLYESRIHPAFDKLAENIINTFKFTYFDYPFADIKNEVVAFMVMNIHKYDHTKGSKAFSYFSVVAKNYLILHNNNNYKMLKIHDSIDTIRHNPDKVDHDYDDFIECLSTYFDINIPNIFRKKRDIQIAYAVVELLVKREEIENFNKKALYILIREMTNVDTNHITKVVNVMRNKYKILFNEYTKTGVINYHSTGSKFFK
tara:strand:+ start:331 stop:1026 length:696 start_codon:yes stop_codon:yes gene_type:complete